MRETRKSNNLSQQQLLNDVRRKELFFYLLISKFFLKKKLDVLRQAVENEYTKFYRQTHKTAVKTVR
jgi:hypothetical protein